MSVILKKCRVHKSNRTISYYRTKQMKRAKWYRIARKPIRYKVITNKIRLSPLSYTSIQYLRRRGLSRIVRFNRLYWKCIYPGINVDKIRFDNHKNLRHANLKGKSRLWEIESRLDVLLWRSGIASTISIGKHLVRSGIVQMFIDGTWVVAERSDMVIDLNTVLKVTDWDSIKITLNTKWRKRKYVHTVPNYILVDYINGRLALTRIPHQNDLLVPSNRRLRVR